jgi:hypothetical protein
LPNLNINKSLPSKNIIPDIRGRDFAGDCSRVCIVQKFTEVLVGKIEVTSLFIVRRKPGKRVRNLSVMKKET